jgi:hypothetical protein
MPIRVNCGTCVDMTVLVRERDEARAELAKAREEECQKIASWLMRHAEETWPPGSDAYLALMHAADGLRPAAPSAVEPYYGNTAHPNCGPATGHVCAKPSGQICFESGCGEQAGTPWGPLWCPDHDAERLDRIRAQLTELSTTPRNPLRTFD